jgi:alpha-galactosidase
LRRGFLAPLPRPLAAVRRDQHPASRQRVAAAVRPSGRHHTTPFFDALATTDGLVLDGAWLAHAGLPLPRVQAETAYVVHLQAL